MLGRLRKSKPTRSVATYRATRRGEMLDDGDEHIEGHCVPDAHLRCILARARKTLDPRALFDPFQEQSDPPTVLVT